MKNTKQLDTATKIEFIKTISNYDFYTDLEEYMHNITKQTPYEHRNIELNWWFDPASNVILLQDPNYEYLYDDYDQYDELLLVFSISYGKEYGYDKNSYEQNLDILFSNYDKNFDMHVKQGKFETILRSCQDKHQINLNIIKLTLSQIIYK